MDEFRKSHLNDRLSEGNYREVLDQAQLMQQINQCGLHCNGMITYILDQEGLGSRRRQLKLLRDCESLCCYTASQLAAQSFLTPSLVKLCAYTCEHCGRECAQFEDALSQRCSQICLTCAKQCEEANL